MKNILAVSWGLFQLVILSAGAIFFIIIYRGFGAIYGWVQKLQIWLTHTYKDNILNGANKNLQAAWYYPSILLVEILLFFLWVIVTPAGLMRDLALKALEDLS